MSRTSPRQNASRRTDDRVRANRSESLPRPRDGLQPAASSGGGDSPGIAGAAEAFFGELAARVAHELEGRLAELLTPPAPERPFDRRGLATYLSCSLVVVDKLRAEGIPKIRVGDCDRFEREAVLAWLRTRP